MRAEAVGAVRIVRSCGLWEPAWAVSRQGLAFVLRRWLLAASAGLAACDGPPDRSPTLGDVNLQRGRQLMVEKGCTACHAVPGVAWPRGGLGPALHEVARQGLIAGQLPNQPGLLMQFVRNAPALVPGTAMPAIPMTDQEARDVTAYLLQQRPR